jgi:hypothetical protein
MTCVKVLLSITLGKVKENLLLRGYNGGKARK